MNNPGRSTKRDHPDLRYWAFRSS